MFLTWLQINYIFVQVSYCASLLSQVIGGVECALSDFIQFCWVAGAGVIQCCQNLSCLITGKISFLWYGEPIIEYGISSCLSLQKDDILVISCNSDSFEQRFYPLIWSSGMVHSGSHLQIIYESDENRRRGRWSAVPVPSRVGLCSVRIRVVPSRGALFRPVMVCGLFRAAAVSCRWSVNIRASVVRPHLGPLAGGYAATRRAGRDAAGDRPGQGNRGRHAVSGWQNGAFHVSVDCDRMAIAQRSDLLHLF